MIKIQFKLTIIKYKEKEIYYVYAPQLDIYGYDTTPELAIKSFKISLQEYFMFAIQNDTLAKDLQKHGWKLINNKFKPPKVSLKGKFKDIDVLKDKETFNFSIA